MEPKSLISEIAGKEEDLTVAVNAMDNLLDRLSGSKFDQESLHELLIRLLGLLRMRDLDDVLKAVLPILPYSEYLKTNHWETIRKRTLHDANYKCRLCHESDVELHAHHSCYERIGREGTKDLICLCKDCHKVFHENRSAKGQYSKDGDE